jgi:hypothetical protein
MKITQQQLKQLIKEELQATTKEQLKLVEARDVIDRTAVQLLQDISAKLDTLPERIADAMGRE